MFRRTAAVAVAAAALLQGAEAALSETVRNVTASAAAGQGNTTVAVEPEAAGSVRAAATAGSICSSRDQGLCSDRKQEALKKAGWTLEKAASSKCSSFHEEGLKPGGTEDEIYFKDDKTGTCWQVKENGKSSITVGKCLYPNGQTKPSDKEENWECLGRCGPGCSDATDAPSLWKYGSHWSKGCLLHDLCTYFTDSPQDPTGKLPGPLNSETCKTAALNAAAGYSNPVYTYVGDSSSSKLCAR